MSTMRYHKAAKDGLLEVLKEATKRDTNARDEQGMTPTLYAAFYGHLEALKVLCSRGGDPEKSDFFGNTGLHLAAAQGHRAIVTFLVNFGVNIYSMDIDEHTAQELAGINNKDDILRFLDDVAAKLESTDKKKAKNLKEKARKDAEKKIKEFNKRQAKADMQAQRFQKKVNDGRPSVINTLKMRMKSNSVSNLSSQAPTPRFSTLVSGGTVSKNKNISGTVQKRILLTKNKLSNIEDEFKIQEIEDGKRSIRSVKGIKRDSEVLYGETFDLLGKEHNNNAISDSEDTTDPRTKSANLVRSVSQPDFFQETDNINRNEEQSSIFNRAGLGSLAFRKSITSTLQTIPMNDVFPEDSSIGSAGSLAFRQRQFTAQPFDDELSDSESSEDDNPYNALERFLTVWGLREYMPQFEEQKIDLNTLMLLTESDLKSLNLPLGPYRKLVNAISERKMALENPGEVQDSHL